MREEKSLHTPQHKLASASEKPTVIFRGMREENLGRNKVNSNGTLQSVVKILARMLCRSPRTCMQEKMNQTKVCVIIYKGNISVFRAQIFIRWNLLCSGILHFSDCKNLVFQGGNTKLQGDGCLAINPNEIWIELSVPTCFSWRWSSITKTGWFYCSRFFSNAHNVLGQASYLPEIWRSAAEDHLVCRSSWKWSVAEISFGISRQLFSANSPLLCGSALLSILNALCPRESSIPNAKTLICRQHNNRDFKVAERKGETKISFSALDHSEPFFLSRPAHLSSIFQKRNPTRLSILEAAEVSESYWKSQCVCAKSSDSWAQRKFPIPRKAFWASWIRFAVYQLASPAPPGCFASGFQTA